MAEAQHCRTCLAERDLCAIFAIAEHHEKYSQVILEATGVHIIFNDAYSQLLCSSCITSINNAYKFRRKCQQTQLTLSEALNQNRTLNIEQVFINPDSNTHSIDITHLLDTNINENNIAVDDFTDNHDNNDVQDIELSAVDSIEVEQRGGRNKKKCKEPVKRGRPRKAKTAGKDTGSKQESEKTQPEAGATETEPTAARASEKEHIECSQCHKVLTSRLSLRNHYKIHTGFDVVCEHCGKKFISRRLLLMHCKAKHGYEKTDKCSHCDYRASNAEQVKIHERLHTGERPYACGAPRCSARFLRRSTLRQHEASHLPDKTVPCEQCDARFKSWTLMRVHLARHRAARRVYACALCARTCARRRNVARHLQRAHALPPHAAAGLVRRLDADRPGPSP